MARSTNLEVVVRDLKKKPLALRREGLVPAVVYGPAVEKNIHISIPSSEFDSILGKITEASLINLIIKDGEKTENITVFLKTIQRHRVSDRPIHADFYVPAAGHYMHLNIPVQYIGEPIGVENGGILQTMVYEIPIEVLPKNVIEYVEIDISNLDIFGHITLEDIKDKFTEDTKILMDEDTLFATITKPGAEEEPSEESDEDENLEPEAIEEKGSNE
jgi:large subunit ribosomal protein L25